MSRMSTSLMATPSKAIASIIPGSLGPATPKTAIPPSPGTFRHPQLTEIIQRQSASALTSRKIQNAGINSAAIVFTFVLKEPLSKLINTILTAATIPSSTLEASTIVFLIRLLFLANIAICLRPVLPYISQKDDISDIPLTPSQRTLLGLPASDQNSPVASSAGFVTPPRYRRDGGMNASTPLQDSPSAFSTGRRSTSANYFSSPLSTSRHALGFSPSPQQNTPQTAQSWRRTSESQFAAVSSGGSPLLQRATSNELGRSTLASSGDRPIFSTSTSSLPFGLSRSHSLRERKGGVKDTDSVPGTPSPNGPKRQPGVNYKWLYDRGARLPRSESTGF